MRKLDSYREFDAYRRLYSGAENSDRDFMPSEQMLYIWERNKERLYNLLGMEFVISRKLAYDRPHDEMAREIEILAMEHNDFLSAFYNKIEEEYPYRGWSFYSKDLSDAEMAEARMSQQRRYVLRELTNTDILINGRVNTGGKVSICGQEISINHGEKAMKALGKVARAMNLEEEFERFRVAHSLVMNQKRITGELCLSIHPMDFATASDNAQGWSSCMSWQEGGCYRMGTVEMMNSPLVLCAYIKSDKNELRFGHGGDKWNSKKWRAWIIVDKNAILCNRQYPYNNDFIAIEAVKWVRELAEANLGWNFFEQYVDWQEHGMEYDTNFMYNDVSDDQICCLRYDHAERSGEYINFSGPAQCMWCGEEISFDSDEREDWCNTLICGECMHHVYCADCGRDLTYNDDDTFTDPETGEILCPDCYYSRYRWCEECQEYVPSDEVYNFQVLNNTPLEAYLMKDIAFRPDVARAIGYPWEDYAAILPEKTLEHNSYLSLMRALRDECRDGTVCRDCMEKYGVDLYDDDSMITGRMLVWNSLYRHETSRWCSNLINPATLTYEGWCQLCDRPHTHYRFPEQESIQRALFENYKQRFAHMMESDDDETAEIKYGEHYAEITALLA